MSAAVLPPVRETFRAFAETVIPETVALDATGWATVERLAERALTVRTEQVRRQLVLFIRLVEYLALFTYGRRFSRLGPEPRRRFLKALERSRFLLVRRGAWGLRTLVLLGYYTQPAVQAQIGYRAHRDGWAARREVAPTHSP